MSFTPSQFEAIQPDLFAKIDSEPFFSTVSLFKIRHEDLQSKINEALGEGTFDPLTAGKLPGACVEVMMPTVRNIMPAAPEIVADVQVLLRVLENHEINIAQPGGTTLSAETIAFQLLRVLQMFQSDGMASSWFGISQDFNADFHPLVCYDVVVGAKCASASLPQAASPSIKEVWALTFTLSCPTPGAAIYYTIDGSYPANNAAASFPNSDGTLYTGPFVVAPGALIRYAAYAPGCVGSTVNRFTANS